MNNTDIETIIAKFFADTISGEELVTLRDWLNDSENRARLESYVRDEYDVNLALLKNDVDAAFNKVMARIASSERPVKKLFQNWVKLAAAVVLLFGLGFVYQQNFFEVKKDVVLVPEQEAITLQLGDGSVETIDISKTKEVRKANGTLIGKQQQDRLDYSEGDEVEELVYHTILIPNGKRFQLALSDGTLVHMNAGSSMRYPVHFLQDGPREVFLIGEAFFDVTENPERPFIVNVNDLDVKVLGTAFNVSAYEEDPNIDVVLVEGAVNLNFIVGGQDRTVDVFPGQKGSFENSSKELQIDKVNTALYTSWMQGHLVFRNMTFDNILAKLERHYNIQIENKNAVLGKEVFNASFDKVPLERILEFFNETHKIEYEINDNKVIIK